jgi:hypothetical protein
MTTGMKPATTPPMREGEARHEQITPRAGKPGEDEDPDSTEDTPPGEHKREPINDPDPADEPLQVRHG